ncbi:GNAT family N-acetyltransferase [Treponema sp.]|uniref:GNAT family N-acetyltransferase n=1 Tax=Treponema sp. TaxID=166 RepID=UPI003FD776BF
MNILIDTNILIPLEDTSNVLNSNLATFCRLCSELNHKIYLHPSQKDDLERDKNNERKEILISREERYQILINPPKPSNEEILSFDWKQKKDNDRVDNELLYALYRNVIHILVTNDEEIHKKAKKVDIEDKVYRLSQIISFFYSQSNPSEVREVGIQNDYVYQMDRRNLFFDSLRDSYPKFDDWFDKICKEHRKCWYIKDNKNLVAICIYKEENNEVVSEGTRRLEGKILKLCTLKVAPEYRGRKLGEKILSVAFKYCVDNNFDWVYLHANENKQQSLIELCHEYGFIDYGNYKGDKVVLKAFSFIKNEIDNPLKFNLLYYPKFLDNNQVGKYIVPIKPDYHNDLFANISDMAYGLFADEATMYSAQSNTIKKAYLCHAKIKSIQAGDILLFYRTEDRKSIQCMGIAEKVFFSTDKNEVFPLIAKRTVYSEEELKEILTKKTMVILFRYIEMKKSISSSVLEKAKIKGPIQTIRKITNEQYNEIMI